MSAAEDLLGLPSRSGAYRWFYADVTSGDFTAVFIFMVGAVFSPRYSSALRRGALPAQHSAVNFALYEKGARWLWVLSEYETARVEGRRLRIGSSHLELKPDGGLRAHVVDRTAPWGHRAEARLELEPLSPAGPELALVEGRPHWWQPIAPMARGTVSLPAYDVTLTGTGYHDTNHGFEPLGHALAGWRWARLHRPGETWVDYRPFGKVPSLRVQATGARVDVRRVVLPAAPLHRTVWGLSVPQHLAAGQMELPGAPMLLESSPFYARLEASSPQAHALSEVADFKRFHRPYVRWMAHFRSRVGQAPAAGDSP